MKLQTITSSCNGSGANNQQRDFKCGKQYCCSSEQFQKLFVKFSDFTETEQVFFCCKGFSQFKRFQCTMLFNPVQATRQAHLPEGTTAQFLSVGNALGYGRQKNSDLKVFAIHLLFNCGSTWIHSFLATPKYLMALAQATGTQPSLTMTIFFVFLPTLPMHCL